MKKLTLTFCALFAMFIVAPALFADGPEKYSGKEKEVIQPAPPVCEWYRAHEWDLDIWGSYVFSANPGRNDVAHRDPFTPDEDPTNEELTTSPVTFTDSQVFNPNERVNIGQVSKDQLMGRDNTFGGGVDVKYFWSRYLGAGIEGVGIPAKTDFAGGELATLTFRYPLGRFAPYGFGGIGAIEGGGTIYRFFNEKHIFASGLVVGEHEFWTDDLVHNNKVRGLGQLGLGLEYRLTCHIGLMADFSWNFVFGRTTSPDKNVVLTEQGQDIITVAGVPIISTTITNKATNLVPGTGSDNQDFGMVRFGVTFSY